MFPGLVKPFGFGYLTDGRLRFIPTNSGIFQSFGSGSGFLQHCISDLGEWQMSEDGQFNIDRTEECVVHSRRKTLLSVSGFLDTLCLVYCGL